MSTIYTDMTTPIYSTHLLSHIYRCCGNFLLATFSHFNRNPHKWGSCMTVKDLQTINNIQDTVFTF